MENFAFGFTAKQSDQLWERALVDGLKPFVLPVRTDNRCPWTQVLTIDVEIAFLIDVRPQVTTVRPVDLVSQRDNSPNTVSRSACYVSTSSSFSACRNRSKAVARPAGPIPR